MRIMKLEFNEQKIAYSSLALISRKQDTLRNRDFIFNMDILVLTFVLLTLIILSQLLSFIEI